MSESAHGGGDGRTEGPAPGPEPVLGSRRRFSPAPRNRPITTVAESVHRLSAFAGALIGVFLGLLAGLFTGHPVLTALAAGALFYFGVLFIANRAGAVAGTIYAPRGDMPKRREYSLAEAHVANGRYGDAVLALMLAHGEHPDDPEPSLRLARLYRDHFDEPEEALTWFRTARDAPGLDPDRWAGLTRELIELIEGPMDDPRRAAPELARLAERAPGTPHGEWAARELAEVKRAMREDVS